MGNNIDTVIYDKETKEVMAIIYSQGETHIKTVVHNDFAMADVDHDSNYLINKDGVYYFENPDKRIIYLDEYRGRYSDGV